MRRKEIKKGEMCVQCWQTKWTFLCDKENLKGLNIHFEEPFNQKVEYNVRTEYEAKIKKKN